MKKIFVVLTLTLSLALQGQKLTKIEPSSWWAGMQMKTVEFMVYGKDISELTAVGKELKVISSTALESPNYLFVTVEIPDDSPSGTHQLLLKDKQVYLVGGGPNRDRSLRQLILNSSDNGETWRCQSPVGAPLHSLVLNNRNLIAVGLRGVVVRSDDRLGIWQTISFGNTWQFRSTIATNSLALVTGTFGVIARSTNGGKVWKVGTRSNTQLTDIVHDGPM